MSIPLVLIVEDDPDIAELVAFHLQREGFATKTARSGRIALDIAQRDRPGLVMLDIMLPDLSGLDVCRQMKASESLRETPIVMVSAKGEEADVVVGLELGADDYITKPFSPRVLAARVKAVLRRRAPAPAGGRIVLGDGVLVIDAARHRVEVGGQGVELTLTQFQLLHYLALRPGFVRTRQQLVSAVRGDGTVLSSRAIDVHIAGLRNKLGPMGNIIETVRGVGYRVVEERAGMPA